MSQRKENVFRLGMLVLGFVMAWAMLTISEAMRGRPIDPQSSVVEVSVEGLEGGAVRFGDKDASNRIIVFSDYECPFCQRHMLALDHLLSKRSDILVEYHHYPITDIHPGATVKARLVECIAAVGGDARSAHRAIFELVGHADSAIARIARMYGPETAVLNCVAGRDMMGAKVNQVLRSDFAFSSREGIRATPSSIVNGTLVPGAVPMEVLVNMLK